MTEFLALGRFLDAAFATLPPAVVRLAERGFTDLAVLQFLADTHLEGTRLGYQFHGNYLGAPQFLNRSVVDEWLQASGEEGNTLMRLLAKRLDEEPREQPWIVRWLEAAARQTLMRGQDRGGSLAAQITQAEWKRWVRAWPRHDHRQHSYLEGKTIPVDDLFVLPNGRKVWGPRDWQREPDPGEWINCSHALAFLEQVTQADLQELYTPPTKSKVFANSGGN